MADVFKGDIGKNIILKVGKMGVGEAMGSDLEQTACMLENTFDITNESGEELEIRCEGGRVLETARKEGDVVITGELYSLADRSKFWAMDGKKVKSLINNDFMSVELSPEGEGSEGMRIPKTQIEAGIAYNTTDGWRIPLTITVLKTSGEDGYFWEFFTVEAPVTD